MTGVEVGGHRGDHDSWAQSPGEGLPASQPTQSLVHIFLFPEVPPEEDSGSPCVLLGCFSQYSLS